MFPAQSFAMNASLLSNGISRLLPESSLLVNPAQPAPPTATDRVEPFITRTPEQEQALNQQLATANDQLHDANQGLRTTNAALLPTQEQQQQLNHELEVRVAERTQALRDAVAEAEVKRRQLHDLFDQAPMAITVVRGPRYVIELANPVVCTMWGRTQQQAVGTPLFELIPEAAGQGFEELFDGVMATGQPHVAYETPSVIDRHGRRDTVYWDFTFQPLRDATGQVTGVTVLATEVSERVTARRHLAAQQQLQAVFEQAPVAIGVFTGSDYVVDVCNPGLQAIWGRTAAQAVNRPLFEVLPEIRDQGFKELLDEVMASGVPYLAHEVPLQVLHQGQPSTVYVNFVYHPLRDVQGHVGAIAAVATDVSEQVTARRLVQQLNEANVLRLNEELAASNEDLRATNQELLTNNDRLTRANVDLDNFIYTASHDLKMPIDNIEGLLQGLREEIPLFVQATDHVQPMLDMMQESINRFQLTIAQLTDLTKLRQAHALPTETLDLPATVEAVRRDLAPLLTAAAVQLTVTMDTCSTGAFSGKNLRSIVYNLLSNAIKYRHADRSPVIHLRCHSTATVLEVEDNGLGLDEAQQGKLFGMFQRLHTHVEGSGIGLYIVKRIVENAGGTIAVRSQPGVGTTFTVTFPG